MKKRLIATILLLIVPMLGLFAATDIDLALSAKTGMNINLSKPTDRSFSTKIDAELESIIGVYFDGKKSGLDMLFGTDFKQSFILGAGYAYRTNLEASSDFILAAGPYFKFGNDFNVGFYARAEANLRIVKNFFVKVGTGIDFEFLQFKDSGTSADLLFSIPLPRIALGWAM